jgi:hypothetical protein
LYNSGTGLINVSTQLRNPRKAPDPIKTNPLVCRFVALVVVLVGMQSVLVVVQQQITIHFQTGKDRVYLIFDANSAI